MMMLSEIAKAVGGEIHGRDMSVLGVSTDTRNISPGDLFVALRGDRFDAEDFVASAQKSGAGAVVVTRVHSDVDVPQLVVSDTTSALGEIAHLKRQGLSARVIAITGSCGKTSVKGMLKSILTKCGKTCATRANFNNQFGVPLTLLEAANDAEFLVVEAGTSYPGEISKLADIIDPDIAVVINVHSAHFEGFGSRAAIVEEKAALYRMHERKLISIVNANLMCEQAFAPVSSREGSVIFSTLKDSLELPENGLYADEVSDTGSGCSQFTLCTPSGKVFVELAVLGAHQVENALAAATCAYVAGAPLDKIQAGLQEFNGEKGRMQFIKLQQGFLVDDSYNANPASMRVAIDYLSQYSDSILVLGDMGELGEITEQSHKDIGAYARRKNIQNLIVMGANAELYNIGFGGAAVVFRDHDEISNYLLENINGRSAVLVKGSRYTKMDVVCKKLQEERGVN